MAEAKFTDLPSQVLIKIFHFVIYNRYDINEYLIPQGKGVARGWKPLREKQVLRRLSLRLVCTYFRDTIDSATFWVGKTIKAWMKSKGRRAWAYLDKIGVASINVPPSWLPSSHWKTFLFANLKSMQNLRHIEYSCYLDENSFGLLQHLSQTPLQSVAILNTMHWHMNCDHVKGNLTLFLSVISGFSSSLRKLTIQAGITSLNFQSDDQCYLENIKKVEMVFNKHSLVSKLKQALPLLQEVVLRNFLDGNTFGDIKSVMEQSSHFLRTVNSLLLVEKLHDTHALGSIELPFSPVDEIFKESKEGTMEMKSVLLVVSEDTFEEPLSRFKDMVEVKSVIILQSSPKNIKYSSAMPNWKMLEALVVGSVLYPDSTNSHSMPLPLPAFPRIIGTLQCFDNLANIHFHKQALLTNRDIETISRCNGVTIKEMYLGSCPNIHDLCLFYIKLRFQNLLILSVVYCKQIKGTFLQQNYQGLDTVPKIRRIKFGSRSANKSDQEIIVNAITLVRTHSRNKVQMVVF